MLKFEEGKLYGDKDGGEMLFFVHEGFLFDFVVAEYDEEKCDFFPTNEEIRLTKAEAARLIKW